MSFAKILLASLWYHRRIHLAVAAGVAVATTVIAGALLVGDSVRGSLRDLAIEGLGRIDTVLVAETPFRVDLAEELAASDAVQEYFEGVAPILTVSGTLATTDSARATQLTFLGCDHAFWQFDIASPPALLAEEECAITQSIADELGIVPGDTVLLRLPLLGSAPADSPLGEKTDATTSLRLQVATVLPNEGLARFSLRPNQQAPRNVFLPLATLQKALGLKNRTNMLAIGGKTPATPVAQARFEMLEQSLSPTLEDFNLHLDKPSGFEYLRMTSDRLVLPPSLREAIQRGLPEANAQPAIAYLANTLVVGKRTIPYSIITGIDSRAKIGPLLDNEGQPIVLADDEIVLNDWAANDLQAKPGDLVTVTFYMPETPHGRLQEGQPLELRLRVIAALHNEQGQSTLASDPQLTPDLPGVTDQRSIGDWDLPFDLVEPIRPQDEDYWDQYRTTPKAFISYQLAARLWKTRWGTDSVLRIATSTGLTKEMLHERVRLNPAEMGMTLLPVKRRSLHAARGTTAFAGLFLGFSFFLMASAVMLIALLVRLGIETRASEIGLLSAIGWSCGKLRQLLLGEAAVVVLIGAALGIASSVGYARLMIHGLTTWWVAATVTPFLKLHVLPQSLAVGAASGGLVALVTIWWALRKLVKLPARQLMSGDCTEATDLPSTFAVAAHWIPAAMIASAAVLGVFALRLEGEAQAAAFFGSGSLVLGGILLGLRQKLRQKALTQLRSLSLAGLAARNARRNPGRTILSVGLAAVASFLIVALSAFRLAPTDRGTGGFELIATSDQPLVLDLNSPSEREEFGFSDQDNQRLNGVAMNGFRVRAGEDASCLNLYQTSQPQVVGVPKSFYGQSKFGWAGHLAETSAGDDRWQLLDLVLDTDENKRAVVPIVLDKNTAMYSLHLSGVGSQFSIQDASDQPVTLQVVGLLDGSILQGKVLMSESQLLRLYPETAGQQLFLIRMADGNLDPHELSKILESRLEDYGFDAAQTSSRLAELMAVQNTYLSTFQSLGALGLLLGTFGLAVAQLRSVLERRGEFALLRSTGFRNRRLAEMVLGENMVLLLSGLGIGCLAALVAVLPHWFLQSAETPWGTLGSLLLAILLAGVAAGWLAIRAAIRAPLLPALRGD